jgi:hypothetical protein
MLFVYENRESNNGTFAYEARFVINSKQEPATFFRVRRYVSIYNAGTISGEWVGSHPGLHCGVQTILTRQNVTAGCLNFANILPFQTVGSHDFGKILTICSEF